MADRKSFLLYTDYRQHLELLTDEERGKLFIALFDYAECNQRPPLTGAPAMAFSFIKSQMDRDQEKYESVCKRNRENGSKGGRPHKAVKSENDPQKPKETDRFFEEPKKADNDNDNDTDTDIPPISPRGIDKRFNKFWEAYPKKVGKGAAEKSFKKYKTDNVLLSAMLKALERQKCSDQWKKDGGQFIPNPSTWLNQRRWEDEGTGPEKYSADDLEEY